MTGKERVLNALDRKPVDRLPAHDGLWNETAKRWVDEGHLREEEDHADHFGWDFRLCGGLAGVADLDFEPEVIEETEETILTLDGNGAKLMRHKLFSTTPEHVDFAVKDRMGWEESIKPHLVDRKSVV